MYAIHELRFNTFEQEVLFCGVVKGLPAMFSNKAGGNVHALPDGEYIAEFPGQNRRYIATPFNRCIWIAKRLSYHDNRGIMEA